MLDESILVSTFSSLVGTLIGGGVTLLATHMTIRHQNELEDMKRKLALEDDWRRYERENLTRLQEAIQLSFRVIVVNKLLNSFSSGSGMFQHLGIALRVGAHTQRQYLEDILLLSARLPGNELNDAMIMYREKTRRMTLESQNESQLNAAMNELIKQYDLYMALVGEKLRRCIGSYE